MTHISSPKAVQGSCNGSLVPPAGKGLVIRLFILSAAVFAILTVGVTLCLPRPMELPGHIAAEGVGYSRSPSTPPQPNGNLQDVQPFSGHHGEGAMAMPNRKPGHSAYQRLMQDRDADRQSYSNNSSTGINEIPTSPVTSNGSIQELALKDFGNEQDDYSATDTIEQSSLSPNGSFSEHLQKHTFGPSTKSLGNSIESFELLDFTKDAESLGPPLTDDPKVHGSPSTQPRLTGATITTEPSVTNSSEERRGNDKDDAFVAQATLIAWPQARAGTSDVTASQDVLSASFEITEVDNVTATDVLVEGNPASVWVTESSAGEMTEIITESVKGDSPGTESISVLVTVSSTDTLTEDTSESGTASGKLEESSSDNGATSVLVPSSEVGELTSETGFADATTPNVTEEATISAQVQVTGGSSETFAEDVTSEKSSVETVAVSVAVTNTAIESFTEEVSTEQSTTELETFSVLVTNASTETFTESISSEKSSVELDSATVLVTNGSSETFTEAITTVEHPMEMASSLIEITSESTEAFTEVISTDSLSVEMASATIPLTGWDNNTVTDVITSETNAGDMLSSTISITSGASELLTETITSQKDTAEVISSALPVTSGYSEEVTEVLEMKNSTSAKPVTTAVDAVTASDLIEITENITAAADSNTSERPSTAILITGGESVNATATIGDLEVITSSEIITAVDLLTFREELNSTESDASSSLESTAILITRGESDNATATIGDSESVTSSEIITAVDLLTFREGLSNTESDTASALESTAIFVTSGETSHITGAIQDLDSPTVTAPEIITADELITFTVEMGKSPTSRVPVTPLPLVTMTDEPSQPSSEAPTTEASPTESTADTVVGVSSSTETSTDTTPSTGVTMVTDAISATTEGKATIKPPLSGEIYCNTSFCEAEGRFLSGSLKGRSIDPCDNFYAYVCEGWSRASPDALTIYADAADALAGTTEEKARRILTANQDADLAPLQKVWATCNQDASATKDKLAEVLSSLGVDLKDVQKASAEEALRAGGRVQFMLGVAPLAFVSLDSYIPKGYSRILALEEGDALMSPQDAVTSGRKDSVSALACVYLQAVAPDDQRSKDLCDSIADVAVQLAKVSLLDKPTEERMTNYSLETWDSVATLAALFQAMNGSRSYMGDNKPVLLKNQELSLVLKTIIQTMPEHVYRYVGFHATAYLSPYLESMDALWEMALFVTARRMPRRKMPRERFGRMVDEATLDDVVGRFPPQKWRLCLHIVDRLLPGALVVAYARASNDTAFFMELMADVIAEEVRSTFVDQVGRMNYFDNWTRDLFKLKGRTTKLYSLFPLRQFYHQGVVEHLRQVQTKLQNVNSPFDIFLKASSFIGSLWMDPKRDFLHENRYGSTLFDTECLDWPQHDTVTIPMGMFNHSIPTSPMERMFHVPGIGHRLAVCLFHQTFAENFYNPFAIYWTREASQLLKTKEDCFAKQYRANDYRAPYVFTRIGENAALRVAFEDFQQRLYTKRYLNKDYRLESLNMTADQMFFVYYTLSYCSDYSQDSADRKIFVQDRVNVPLMNMIEFATAFNCASGKQMNPSTRCHFWK